MVPAFEDRFVGLGLKGLAFAPLLKAKDYEALASWWQQCRQRNARVQAFSLELEAFKTYVAQRVHLLQETLESLALQKRLDSGFRKVLEKKAIIVLNNYIWEILDLDGLVAQSLKRQKRNNCIECDYEREVKRDLIRYAG